jgi:hypothetical protein
MDIDKRLSGQMSSDTPQSESTFFRRGQPKNTWDKIESVWASAFYLIGCGASKYIFGTYPMPQAIDVPGAWQPVLNNKDPEDRLASFRVRGIFNIRNMLDGTGFLWLKYASKHSRDLDKKAHLEVQFTNIGLLAALVSTICFAMLQSAFESDFPIDTRSGLAYAICWVCASFLTLGSTVLSIVLVIAINMLDTTAQLDYFIVVFQYISLGVGTLTPLYLLYLGAIFTAIGLLFGAGLYFNDFQIIIVVMAAFTCILLFAWCYLFMVAALQASTQTVSFLQHKTKEVSLSVEDVRSLLEKYADSLVKDKGDSAVDYIEVLGSCEDFLQFIINTEFDNKKSIGDTLRPYTERRVRRIYECVMEANLLQTVHIKDVVLSDVKAVAVLP